MADKGEKKLCWNCDGYVGMQLCQCPYCGSELTPQEKIFPVPKGGQKPFQAQEYTVSQEEWNEALKGKKKEEATSSGKGDPTALLLLLPGVVFFLFALALFFFAEGGTLTLTWDKDFAYFYLFGALPLLFFGWRKFK